MSSSVDGLVSGLDTTSLINSLIAAEATTQTSLKSRVTDQQMAIKGYQSVNTSMTALLSAAKDMGKAGALNVTKATSSSTDVAASVSSSAKPGSFDFTVIQPAKAEVQLSASYASLADTAATGPSVSVTVGGVAKDPLVPKDSGLGSLVDAINSRSDLGMRAAAVSMGDGTYRLQVASSGTGESAAFVLGGTAKAMTTTQAGQDAKIALAGAPDAIIKSSTNTFTNVTPGLTFTVNPKAVANQDVSISITQDGGAVAASMSKLVEAANTAIASISSQTAYNAGTKKGSPLSGDFAVRQIQQQIVSAVGLSAQPGMSAADAGVQLTRDGKLTFDKTKFLDTLAKNPDGLQKLLGVTATSSNPQISFTSSTERTIPGTYSVQVDSLASGSTAATGSIKGGSSGTAYEKSAAGNVFSVTDLSAPGAGLTVTAAATGSANITVTTGLAQRLANVAIAATDSSNGSLTRAINGRQSTVDNLNISIADWDVRLDLRKTSLTKTYSNLEVALGKLKNQSSWLAGQLSKL